MLRGPILEAAMNAVLVAALVTACAVNAVFLLAHL